MGRIGCATYFYIYVVQNFALITVFMMMPMFVGAIVMPFGPKVIDKLGRKRTLYVALIFQTAGCKKANERKRRQKRNIFFCPLFLYKKKESKYCMKLG